MSVMVHSRGIEHLKLQSQPNFNYLANMCTNVQIQDLFNIFKRASTLIAFEIGRYFWDNFTNLIFCQNTQDEITFPQNVE